MITERENLKPYAYYKVDYVGYTEYFQYIKQNNEDFWFTVYIEENDNLIYNTSLPFDDDDVFTELTEEEFIRLLKRAKARSL